MATLRHGVWLNLGSTVVMPEVFLKAVSVARDFGHDLDGLVAVNLDKQAQYRSRVNVLDRPAAEGIELIGHHEILLPLLHAAVAGRLQIRRGRRKRREQRRRTAGSYRSTECEIRCPPT